MSRIETGDGKSVTVTLGDGTPVFFDIGSVVPTQPPESLGLIEFSVTTTSFRPSIELRNGSNAILTWQDANGTVISTGNQPTITFADNTVRSIYLHMTDTTGADRYGDITTINLGFNHTQDAGKYGPGTQYDFPATSVIGITGLTYATNLERFMAANTPLTGHLDVHNLSHLEYIECFKAKLTSIDLRGCSSLIRLCLEENGLASIDLNPVTQSLRDLRCAMQSTGHITLSPLSTEFVALYHFCVRDQLVSGMPTQSQLPVVEELLAWNCGLTGTLTPISPVMRDLLVYGNSFTEIDFTNIYLANQANGVRGVAQIDHNPLTVLPTFTNRSRIRELHLHGGAIALSQQNVDTILFEFNSWGTTNGTIVLHSQTDSNSPPSPSGLSAVSSLQARNWTIITA